MHDILYLLTQDDVNIFCDTQRILDRSLAGSSARQKTGIVTVPCRLGGAAVLS
jgi:hypothetical protein